MSHLKLVSTFSVLAALTSVRADLNPIGIFNGHVGLSIDAVGSNNNPVGSIQAHIPDGANVLAAYLYSAGTPYPYYPNTGGLASPQNAADYNASGITLGGSPVNFTGIVGAISDRADIGRWFTGRADVTSVVNSLRTAGTSDYSWSVTEGSLNTRIDGEVLAVVYEQASLPEGSVVLLDGGQRTGGETTTVNFSSPLGDPSAADFVADMSLGISFSTGNFQHSLVNINGNGNRLTTSAGGFDDGNLFDGGLITAGGLGDSNGNPADPFSTASSLDDELYSLKNILAQGDTALTIFSQNDSNDDNIFFMGLRISAGIQQVNDTPVEPPTGAPDAGSTLLLLTTGMISLAGFARRKVLR